MTYDYSACSGLQADYDRANQQLMQLRDRLNQEIAENGVASYATNSAYEAARAAFYRAKSALSACQIQARQEQDAQAAAALAQAEAKRKADEDAIAAEAAAAAASNTAAQQVTQDPLQSANPQNPPDFPTAQSATVSRVTVADMAKLNEVLSVSKNNAPASEDTSLGSATSFSNLSGVSQAASASGQKGKTQIRPNALSKLASYNYIIELQATDVTGAKKLQQNEKYFPEDWATLISTAGGLGGVSALRKGSVQGANYSAAIYAKPGSDGLKWFTKEYYLDDLEFDSIVGVNNNARASADTEVHFTITEPMGINFVQELWEYNALGLGQRNWTETCYLLRITWKGYTDAGEVKDLEDSNQVKFVKYLPIHITNIEVKLTNTGSVYTITATPFNAQANDKRYGVLQKGVQCLGKTIADLLLGQGGKTDVTNKIISDNLTLISVPTNLKYALNQENIKQSDDSKASPQTPSWPTQFDFEFSGPYADEIKNAVIADPENIDPGDTSMNLPKDEKEKRMLENMQSYQLLSGRKDAAGIKLNPAESKVNFNAGQIVEVVTQLITNSTYITNQIKNFRNDYQAAMKITDPPKRAEALEKLKKPFKWFRIVPKIYNTGKYDEASNLDQKRVVYRIIGYEMDNAKGGVSNSLVPGSKTKDIENKVVKEYSYFFTGSNTEIINLDLDFNVSYFNYRPRNPLIVPQSTGEKPVEKTDKAIGTNINTAENQRTKDPISSAITTVPAQTERSGTGVGRITRDRGVAGQITSALYSNVDQITVDLGIMGDPDLIKQDGVWKTDLKETPTKESDEDVPISFDDKERYARLTFITPRDIDDSTGTLQKSGPEEQTVIFSGIYSFITLNSNFKQGKFTQNLLLRRVATDPVEPDPSIKKVQDLAESQGLIQAVPLNNIFDAQSSFDVSGRRLQSLISNANTLP